MIEIIRNVNGVRIAKVCASCQNCIVYSADNGGDKRLCLVPRADGQQREVTQRSTCSKNYMMKPTLAHIKATGKGMVKSKEYLDFVRFTYSDEAPLELKQMETEALREYWEKTNKQSIYVF